MTSADWIVEGLALEPSTPRVGIGLVEHSREEHDALVREVSAIPPTFAVRVSPGDRSKSIRMAAVAFHRREALAKWDPKDDNDALSQSEQRAARYMRAEEHRNRAESAAAAALAELQAASEELHRATEALVADSTDEVSDG